MTQRARTRATVPSVPAAVCLAVAVAVGLIGSLATSGTAWAAPQPAAAAGPNAPGVSEPDPESPPQHAKRGAFTDSADLDLALFSGLTFLMLLGVLTFTAWKPIMAGLKDREDRIAGQIEEARLNAERSRTMLAEYEAKLTAARAEIDELHARSRREVETQREKIVDEARQAAEQVKTKAVAEISAAKKAALDDVARQSVDLAVGLAGKMIAREVSPDVHNDLIRQSLEGLTSRN